MDHLRRRRPSRKSKEKDAAISHGTTRLAVSFLPTEHHPSSFFDELSSVLVAVLTEVVVTVVVAVLVSVGEVSVWVDVWVAVCVAVVVSVGTVPGTHFKHA